MTPIIDAHHHFVDPNRIDYPFLEFLPELDRSIGPEDLRPHLQRAGVEHTICVQAADCEDETVFMLEQAAIAGFVAGVVGWVPLEDPDATAKAVEQHRSQRSLLRGIRHLIHDEADDDWVVREPVLESLGILADHGLAFDLSAFKPRHLAAVSTFAERVPELDVVICHMGMPRIQDGEWEPWAGLFAEAARNPRCAVKISGLDMYLGGASAEKTQRYIDHALTHFGPGRMVWASNWPVSLRGQGYSELLETGRQVISECTPDEQELVLGGNAERIYRLAP